MTKDKDCAPLLREAEKAAKAWRVRCSTDPGDMSMCKPKDDCVFGYTQGYFAALQLFVNVLDIKIKPSFDAADKTKSTRADIEGLAYDVHHHWSVGHKDEAVAAILRFCPLVDTAGVREACAKECEKRGHVTSADAIRAIPTPEAPASVDAKVEAYDQMHEIAKEMGFPSILEALESIPEPDTIGSHFGNGGGLDPVADHSGDATYLICKGGAYYRPNAQGYTRNRSEAGRYTLEEAISYSHPNGPDGPRDGITYELDTAPPSPGFGGGDLREALEHIYNLPGELNLANYNEDDVRELNENFIDAILTAEKALATLPLPEAPASVEPVAAQNDWDKGAQALIKEAAALVQPSEGEAVFYIRVGGEHTSMNVKTKGQVDPDTALKNAIGALNGERSALSNCPVHNNPNGSHHQRGGDLREAREVIAYSIIEGSAGIRAAEHAKDFQTVNWSDALRSADAVIATLAALPPVEQSVGEG